MNIIHFPGKSICLLSLLVFWSLGCEEIQQEAPAQDVPDDDTLNIETVTHAVYSCNRFNDTCWCGRSNPYPCCDNNNNGSYTDSVDGNCTWWAWHKMCCNWNWTSYHIAPPSWGDPSTWITNASNQGYPIGSTPRPGSVFVSGGHVGYVHDVTSVGANTNVFSTEMNCGYQTQYISESGPENAHGGYKKRENWTGVQYIYPRIVLEVEDYDFRRGFYIDGLWHNWEYRTWGDKPGYHNAAMQVLPKSPHKNISEDPENRSPELRYVNVKFPSAGYYYVWVRGWGENGEEDSVHVGIDGDAFTAQRISCSSWRGAYWSWCGYRMDGNRAYVFLGSAGEHTVNLWMRENGFRGDQILLTPDPNFVPPRDCCDQ